MSNFTMVTAVGAAFSHNHSDGDTMSMSSSAGYYTDASPPLESADRELFLAACVTALEVTVATCSVLMLTSWWAVLRAQQHRRAAGLHREPPAKAPGRGGADTAVPTEVAAPAERQAGRSWPDHCATAEERAELAGVLLAVTNCGGALQHAPPRFRRHREVVLAAIGQDPYALQHAAADLKADEGLLLAVVGKNGRVLQHASAELRANKVVVAAAVAQHPAALVHASAELQDCKDIVLAAVAAAKRRRALPKSAGSPLPSSVGNAFQCYERECRTLTPPLTIRWQPTGTSCSSPRPDYATISRLWRLR